MQDAFAYRAFIPTRVADAGSDPLPSKTSTTKTL